LQVSDLDAVAVSQGPGSYTGLRIGVSAAKGICYAGNLPLIGISTLKTIASAFLQANSVSESSVIIPMIDARRMEVYYAEYDHLLYEIKAATPLVIEESSFLNYSCKEEIVFLGSGAEKCKNFLKLSNSTFLTEQTNKAEYMVPLAEKDFGQKNFVDVAYFEPAYLKPFIATQSKKKFF
jgi:tRNA threonylcarbamoyladenosine biosynthesis protein TsaB